MDPFAEPDVTVHVTVIVTSAWETNWVRTSRIGSGGEVLGYQVTDSVGLFSPHATFPEALNAHADGCDQFREAAREAGDLLATNHWAREALQIGIAGQHEPGPLDDDYWP
ncbi:hypothetical protein EXE59_16595 [Nocardioides eburneiflavus]|uniref:Uncharacterized protein n=1 Tax=Nocardioides eburneiflavus TaxID=2518372 RepID=A0A4Z1C7F7_9ACTN|nr:hypothetical protein [Nocardioides eburneiflavus]TGN65392.1 hypothetical protein EXE59_16595 [Nocardioides eburneiflavus]